MSEENLKENKELPWRRMDGESYEAFDAFQNYLFLGSNGSKRSIKKAAVQVGKHESLFSRWSMEWNWVKRAEAFDKYMSEKKQKAHETAIEDMNRRQAEAAMAALMASLETINDYVKKNPHDSPLKMHISNATKLLEVAVKMERVARGEPDSITKNTNELNIKDEENQKELRKLMSDKLGQKSLLEISKILNKTNE